mmetsp:Transcript_99850/g.242809  ORF Transcript_99850/g.242809 Transcript_99850/m.242809 type:complete len:344 (+) Transcript_99850:714-1745(+)
MRLWQVRVEVDERGLERGERSPAKLGQLATLDGHDSVVKLRLVRLGTLAPQREVDGVARLVHESHVALGDLGAAASGDAHARSSLLHQTEHVDVGVRRQRLECLECGEAVVHLLDERVLAGRLDDAAIIERDLVVVANARELLVGKLQPAAAHQKHTVHRDEVVELVHCVAEECGADLIAGAVEQVDREELALAASVAPRADVRLAGHAHLDRPTVGIRVERADGLHRRGVDRAHGCAHAAAIARWRRGSARPTVGSRRRRRRLGRGSRLHIHCLADTALGRRRGDNIELQHDDDLATGDLVLHTPLDLDYGVGHKRARVHHLVQLRGEHGLLVVRSIRDHQS